MRCENEYKTRVNGELLSMYTGQKVVLVGSVQQVDESGTALTVKTTDGMMIPVTLPSAIPNLYQGVIEIHGVAQGQKVLCESHVIFPAMKENEFHAATYNQAVRCCHEIDSCPWKENE